MLVSGQHVVDWVRQRFELADFGPAVGIGWASPDIIGAVAYNGFTRTNICMHVASDGKCRWLSRTFLKAVFRYPFNTLGCKRVTGVVEASNARALDFDLRLGFELEATMKDACESGDLLILRMYRHQCRFLE